MARRTPSGPKPQFNVPVSYDLHPRINEEANERGVSKGALAEDVFKSSFREQKR